jgi:ABC-type nitrate/sulfonate/bicarbonate transport system ATPase subunit
MAYEIQERLLTASGVSLVLNNRVLLRDINLTVDNIVRKDVHQGQVIAVLGPSGVGKTQLFRCLAGLQEPTQGLITIFDKKTPVQSGDIGLVFQSYPLLAHKTVWGNLKLAADTANQPPNKILELLQRFGLHEKRDLYPAQLSGGQRQRISIIQQLLCSNHFMLMDEPFSGLDVLMKRKMMDLILEVSTSHELNTLIITTHDIEAACQLADTIWVLGFQKDEAGNPIPGATLIKTVDLIQRGLAWNKDARHHPNFVPTIDELTELFSKLQ